jgi:hypothetical protein
VFTEIVSRTIKLLLLVVLLSKPLCLTAQTIRVKGAILDTLNHPLTFTIIANKTTGSAIVNMEGAHFEINALASDTLVFSARGYGMRKFAVKDSLIANQQAYFRIKLLPLHQQLSQVSIIAPKTPDAIRKEIDELELKNTNITKSYDAFNNPITALYEAFNKNERAKRQVAEWEYHNQKKKILKETCRLLMTFEVLSLTNDQLNDFVDYLDLSEDFLKRSTNYELGVAIKSQYIAYKRGMRN